MPFHLASCVPVAAGIECFGECSLEYFSRVTSPSHHLHQSPLDFSRRSYKKELLDRDDIPFEDIRRNMVELEIINARLGGHRITIEGLKGVLNSSALPPQDTWHVCEIGCGGGDNLMAIEEWFRKKNLQVRFTGIDINPHCIEVAAVKLKSFDAALITTDYKLVDFKGHKPDILFSSLFCHHFPDAELIPMLGWMRANCTHGFFINDLHRHPLAYYSINMLTRIFSRSYLVKNDAPLSVLRGFRRREWEKLLQSAGISNYSVSWKWAFRYLITVNNLLT